MCRVTQDLPWQPGTSSEQNLPEDPYLCGPIRQVGHVCGPIEHSERSDQTVGRKTAVRVDLWHNAMDSDSDRDEGEEEGWAATDLFDDDTAAQDDAPAQTAASTDRTFEGLSTRAAYAGTLKKKVRPDLVLQYNTSAAVVLDKAKTEAAQAFGKVRRKLGFSRDAPVSMPQLLQVRCRLGSCVGFPNDLLLHRNPQPTMLG